MKRCIAALVVAFVAFPSIASAVPPDYIIKYSESADAPPSHLPAKGTDVAAVDQQASPPADPVSAKGTDVAAPDQQASKPAPAPAADPVADGFDWGDAAVGALAGTALAAFAIAGAVGLRRRPATRIAG